MSKLMNWIINWIGTGFQNPQDIQGLVLWLDAADQDTLFQDAAMTIPVAADNDLVAGWADKSGNANHFTQAVAANTPDYKVGILNGLPVVRFGWDWPPNFPDDYLVEAGVNPSLAVTTLSLFVVYSVLGDFAPHYMGLVLNLGRGSEWTGNEIVHWAAADASEDLVLAEFADSLDNHWWIWSTNKYPKNEWHIFGTTLTTGANGWNFYKDGVVNGSLAGFVLHTGVTPMRIGVGSSIPTFYLYGDIAEYLLYNTALSDTNRGLVETYLRNKWGTP